jgi:formate/nitrite transporter
MVAREPQEIAQVASDVGVKKTTRSWDKVLVSSFLAGAYIAFGGMVAITVSSGLDPEIWGTLPTLFNGAAFSLGLILVIVAGSDLATGNMMLVPLSHLRGKIRAGDVGKNLTLVLIGNLIGSLFVAYFLAIQSGVIGSSGDTGSAALTYERLAAIVTSKAVDHSAWETFLRAVGCNWLVCLAVWMTFAATSVAGKILAIFFPIMAFVAMGFDHVVANMFFLPAGIFAGADITWGDTLVNWLLAGAGNLVGAVVFVATTYWYLFLKDQPEKAPASSEPAERG